MTARAVVARVALLVAITVFVLFAVPTMMVERTRTRQLHDSKEASAQDVHACMRLSVTVRALGRFGNVFMEYASAWAVGRTHGLQLVLPTALRAALLRAFQEVPERTIAEYLKDRETPDGTSCWDRLGSEAPALANFTARDDIQHAAAAGGPVVLAQYSVLVPYVAPLQAELRAHLRFRPELRDRSREVLSALGAATAKDVGVEPHEVVFVGVHVRRTDYPQWLRTRAGTNRTAEEGYYRRALAHLEAALATDADTVGPPPIATVVSSDDMPWVRAVLAPSLRRTAGRRTRVFAAGGAAMERDLALLATCNHTILAYGTFGLSAALLAGGRALAYRLHRTYPTSQLAAALPNWELLD